MPIDGLSILDVFIGLAFIFFSLSLIASSILETVVAMIRYRARFLFFSIGELLNVNGTTRDPLSLGEKFFKHPLIAKKSTKPAKIFAKYIPTAPSYLSGEAFAEALIEVLKDEIDDGASVRSIATAIESMPPHLELKQVLIPLFLKSRDEQEFIERLADWYDEYMERRSGRYKKFTQKALLVIGFVLAVLMNVNTFTYTDALMKCGPLRESLVDKATIQMNQEQHRTVQNNIDAITIDKENIGRSEFYQLDKRLADINNSITNFEALAQANNCDLIPHNNDNDNQVADGQANDKKKSTGDAPNASNSCESCVSKSLITWLMFSLPGYFVTAAAVSLGSAFWLSLLRMMISIRSSVSGNAKRSQEQEKTPDKRKEYVPAPFVSAGEFETLLDSDKITGLQRMLEMNEGHINGQMNIATREALDTWRRRFELPTGGPLTLDEYLKIRQPTYDD